MLKGLALVLFLALAAVSVRLQGLVAKNEELAQQNSEQARQINDLSARLEAEKRKSQQALETEEGDVSQLSGKLQSLRATMASTEQRLNEKKNSAPDTSEIARLESELQAKKDTLAEIQRQIDWMKEQKGALSAQGKQSQDTLNWNEKQAAEELRQKIVQQEAIVKKTSDDLAAARRDKLNFTAQQQLPMMTQNLKDQKVNLQALRDQLRVVGIQSGADKSNSKAIVQTRTAGINQSLHELEGRLADEKKNSQAIERDLASARARVSGWQNEVRVLQGQYDSQKKEFNALSGDEREHENRVRELSH